MQLKNVALIVGSNNAGKAYIEAFQKMNLIPELTILIHEPLAKKITDEKNSYKTIWNQLKRRIKKKIPSLRPNQPVQSTAKELAKRTISNKIKEHALSTGLVLGNYEKEVKQILDQKNFNYIELNAHINDEKLIDVVKKTSIQYFVFGADGRLNEIFSSGKKFIHIHPGVIPYIKGSDCLMYSAIIRNKIGMSLFFMNHGIDTGDIVKTQEYDLPKLDIKETTDFDYSLMQTILIDELDPCYRAQLLSETFKQEPDPNNWSFTAQNPKEGKFYYSIHPVVSKIACKKFIN